MDWKKKLKKIYSVTLKRPYIFSFFIIILIYLSINIFVNQTYITAPTLFSNYIVFSFFFIFFSFFIALLVATNVNLTYAKMRELRRLNKSSGLTAIGAFGGLLGGACPGCFVGLFPAVLGIFGITASLGNLPLYGLEIQVISGGCLLLSLFLLTRENTCKIKLE
jgi:hypothetical protein